MQGSQQTKPIKQVIILGGGTAGWMTAAALSKITESTDVRISLIESPQIGTIGVGEATLPHIREFNDMLGIDEAEFIHMTQASYKLGINFKGWGKPDSDYFHPFSDYGEPNEHIEFHHYYHKAQSPQHNLSFDNYSTAIEAARANKFCTPESLTTPSLQNYSYAYHFDASKYATFLRKYSEKREVNHIEGKVSSVSSHELSGDITALVLENGQTIEGDLFIDCSGINALLIGKTLETRYEDWSHWLKCDRAIPMMSPKFAKIPPYTQSVAHECGWFWTIPLQQRNGNGIVYSSQYLSDDEAQDKLASYLNLSNPLDAKPIKFNVGMRTQCWRNNCIAIGLSSGFLEPLESTSIHLIQIAIYKLIGLFPTTNQYQLAREQYNQQLKNEYYRVRDFIILHYWLNKRDEPFWQACQKMDVPSSLKETVEIFKQSGHIFETDFGLFQRPSWLAVLIGQGLSPQNIDARVNHLSAEEAFKFIENYRLKQNKTVAKMPNHDYWIKQQKIES